MNLRIGSGAASLTKQDIKSAAEDMVSGVEKGERLSAYLVVTKAKATLEIIQSELHDDALEEARKYGRNYQMQNTTLDMRDTGVKWDYSNCNDPELERLQAEFDKAKKALEKRQKFLQALDKPLTTVDEQDGSVEPIYPAVRKATEKLFVNY